MNTLFSSNDDSESAWSSTMSVTFGDVVSYNTMMQEVFLTTSAYNPLIAVSNKYLKAIWLVSKSFNKKVIFWSPDSWPLEIASMTGTFLTQGFRAVSAFSNLVYFVDTLNTLCRQIHASHTWQCAAPFAS